MEKTREDGVRKKEGRERGRDTAKGNQ